MNTRDTQGGTLRVESTRIDMIGDQSAGMVLNIAGGSTATVAAGDIAVTGDRSMGVYFSAREGAALTMTSGAIRIEGDNGYGISMTNAGTSSFDLGSITMTGAESYAIEAVGTGDKTILADLIRIEGDESYGVFASGDEVTLNIDDLQVLGDVSYGIYMPTAGATRVADITVARGQVTGLVSSLAYVYAAESITADFGDIDVDEDGGSAIILSSRDVTATVRDLDSRSTENDAAGVSISASDDATLTIGRIRTASSSDDLFTYAASLYAANDVVVRGLANADGSRGGVIETTGDRSRGLDLQALDGIIDVEIGSVTTSGANSSAIYARNGINGGDATDRLIDIDALAVTTRGARSHGVDVVARNSVVRVGSADTTGGGSHGVQILTEGEGEVRVIADAVTTRGSNAYGVYVVGNPDGAAAETDVIVDVTSVTTSGDSARAIMLDAQTVALTTRGAITTTGQAATAVSATGVDSAAVTILGQISTSGVNATGVSAFATVADEPSGAVVVDATAAGAGVSTTGNSATAVRVGGETVTVRGRSFTTSGQHTTVVHATASEDIILDLGTVQATGADSDGVIAEAGGDITFDIRNGLSVTDGVGADLIAGGTIVAGVAQGATVRGSDVGLRLNADGGSTLNIAGTVSATSGLALDVKGGSATINNTGNTIIGRIDLTANDDVVNNSGRFTAVGTSDYGAGNDVFNNTGIIDMAESTAPRMASFINLERLNNSGTIDLANGVAGDVFSVPNGVINGQAGNSVGLDLDLRGATPAADQIVARGFEGVTNILLSVQGRAMLGNTGVIIAESGSTQTGAEIDIRVAGGGFIGFDLAYSEGAYFLTGELAPPAFEPTKVATGAQHQWTSGADVVSARFDQMRDEGGRPDGRGDQVWAQVYGGSNDIEAKRSFDLLGESLDADLSHEVKSQGVQAGVDRAVPVDNGALVFGMLAGAGKTELRFQNGDVTEYDGVGVGAYGHWFSGPLSIGVLAKLDTFKLDYDWAEANLKTRSDGFTVGARIDAAWRIEAGQGWYVEPQASLSWSDTALGRMTARDGAEVVFGDTTSMVGRIGVRAGAEMAVGNGLSFRPFAAVHALNEFEGDNASTLILGDEAVGVTDRAHGAWGRAVLGASLDAPSGLGGFIQAEGDFGEVEGFTARAGIKFSW